MCSKCVIFIFTRPGDATGLGRPIVPIDPGRADGEHKGGDGDMA